MFSPVVVSDMWISSLRVWRMRCFSLGRCLVSSLALRAAPPVGDLGLVDLVAPVVDWRETGRGADCAVDVDHTAAGAADQVMVVVTHPILVAGRRPVGLDAPDEALVEHDAESVVHGLTGDGADLAG